MTIRNKILLAFSASAILLTAISFIIVYWLFSAYREEEFQQQQNEKIQVTIRLIDHFKQQSEEISYMVDAQDIHDFYDEKLLIYDDTKQLIFSSLDDLAIGKRKEILNELSPAVRWIEAKEHQYDLVGVYLENNGKSYYAISKAYDALGYDKLDFLRQILIIIFLIIVVSVLIISLYLANHLSRPINRLAFLLNRYNLNEASGTPLKNKTSTKELRYLTDRFNELLKRSGEAFAFQKNTINHISHQLKTPVAVLVSELEKLQRQHNISTIKQDLKKQTRKAKSLGDIISTLLEIAKIESGKNFLQQPIRIDEIIFDLLEHFKSPYPDFDFHLTFSPESFTESQMEIKGSALLFKQALENILHNCIVYSESPRASVTISTSDPQTIKLTITNNGQTLTSDEEKLLFHYFFRGQNSQGKSGNGLGLVLTQKIVHLHQGRIRYLNTNGLNSFEISFPLAKCFH